MIFNKIENRAGFAPLFFYYKKVSSKDIILHRIDGPSVLYNKEYSHYINDIYTHQANFVRLASNRALFPFAADII
jgi:hypothetical protein